jgi:hypothetical protein
MLLLLLLPLLPPMIMQKLRLPPLLRQPSKKVEKP